MDFEQFQVRKIPVIKQGSRIFSDISSHTVTSTDCYYF